MFLEKQDILKKLDEKLNTWLNTSYLEFLDEIAMKRVVRNGKIVRKVKVKRPGFKVVRNGNRIKFVRMTAKEKRARRIAARKSWRVAKSSRLNKSKRTMKRSKVRMKMLYK